MKKILLSSVALLGLSVAAQAADLPRRMAAPAPYVAVPVFTWTGFYVGVNAGYGWGSNDEHHIVRLDRDAVFLGSASGELRFRESGGDEDGFLGGAQIGFNYQFMGTGWVVGVETDIQGIDLDRNRAANDFTFRSNDDGIDVLPSDIFAIRRSASSLDYFGTVRARLGYAWDRWLVYATGGFAYGGGDNNDGCPDVVGGTTVRGFCDRGDDIRVGYAVGGGFEWALPVTAVNFFGSSAVTFGIEGLYVNLEDDDNNDPRLVGFSTVDGGRVFAADHRHSDNETDFGLVRAKLNFKF